MDTITLGRTNLRVSAAGLGGGGFSRLGIDLGVDHAASIARAAYDAGVTFFDTAMAYGSEPAVELGLRGIPRDRYVISTKFTYSNNGKIATETELLAALDASLKRLGTDYVDIYHLHAVVAEDYPQVSETLIPALIKAKEQGKLRFPGITERFAQDTSHIMLPIALKDDFFDVVMVGYNILNPSAAQSVLPLTLAQNVGTLCMFAVRSALHNPVQLRADIEHILAANQGDTELLKSDGALEFITKSGAANSLMEAAYRFCRHTPGIDIVLTGTKNPVHLAENLASISMPKLPDAITEKLGKMFAGVDCVSGQ
jgi:aryl-alcohol dehydrogenase-like predicted oxidoreductase